MIEPTPCPICGRPTLDMPVGRGRTVRFNPVVVQGARWHWSPEKRRMIRTQKGQPVLHPTGLIQHTCGSKSNLEWLAAHSEAS